MIKGFTTVILLFFLFPVGLSSAQSQEDWATKDYSGYLLQDHLKTHQSLWHLIFKKKVHQAPLVHNWFCSVEFKSPISFTHQSVAQLPEEISYFIKFKNGEQFFKKFIIKIYSNDDQEYLIDPDGEGRQIGVSDEHHIYDPYLIYLLLGSEINHLEIVNQADDGKDKYVLDKLEIKNDD